MSEEAKKTENQNQLELTTNLLKSTHNVSKIHQPEANTDKTEDTEKLSFLEKAKRTMGLKKSYRQKIMLTEVIRKLNANEPLNGSQKAHVYDAIRFKCTPEEIMETKKIQQDFFNYSIMCTATSLASCFSLSLISKRYVRLSIWAKVPVTFGVFAGSMWFTLSAGSSKLEIQYDKVLAAHGDMLCEEKLKSLFEDFDQEKEKMLDYEQFKKIKGNME
jgi:hypothetical protein